MSKRISVLTLALALLGTPASAETIIVFDDFESYTSSAEMLAAWTPFNTQLGFHGDNGTRLTTDPDGFYGGQIQGQAAEFCGQPASAGICDPGFGGGTDNYPTELGTVNRWSTPFNIAPSATHNIELSVDIGDDALSANKRLTVGLRNTTVSSNIIEMGFYNNAPPGFKYRTVLFPEPPEGDGGWVNYNDAAIMDQPLPQGLHSSDAVGPGFHTFKAVISLDTITFTLDLYGDGLANDPEDPQPGVGTAGVDAMNQVFVGNFANGFDDLRFGLPSHLPSSGVIGDVNASFAAFDNISLKLVPIDVPVGNADFDGDGFVDGHDFLIWQRGFGIDDGTANPGDGDATGDRNVNGADLAVWEQQFGTTPGSIAAVPEPGSVALMLLAMAGMSFRRNR